MIQRHRKSSELQPTLAIGTLVVFYQPQVDFRSGRICGMEALARWLDPKLGLLPPARFLPLVEEASMTKWLTANVTIDVLDQLEAWIAQGLDARVSINLDFDSAEDPEFGTWLEREIAARGVDPARITFEITEEAMIESSSSALATLEAIRERGMRLSLDDYGKGYSCLTRLRDLPITEAKIDKSLVSLSATDWRTLRIVRAMVDLAQDLGLVVVAEGIETRGVWNAIEGTGCDTGQGYLLGHPMPPEEIEHRLAKAGDERRVASGESRATAPGHVHPKSRTRENRQPRTDNPSLIS